MNFAGLFSFHFVCFIYHGEQLLHVGDSTIDLFVPVITFFLFQWSSSFHEAEVRLSS